MYDQVHGRELPNMEDWDQDLIDEAIACKVHFGVLVLGQGSVIGRLVKATPKARMALIRVTWDPRGWMEGVDYPTDMRHIGEIPYPANNFSLMRVEEPKRASGDMRKAARRAIAHARTAAAAKNADRTSPAELEALLRSVHPTEAEGAKTVARANQLSPMRRRILRARAG